MLVIGWKNSVRFCRGLTDRRERLLFQVEVGIIKVRKDAKTDPEAGVLGENYNKCNVLVA